VSERVSFGEFVLDLCTHQLTRGDDPVALSPKAYQLLETLVVNRPRALSKTHLQTCLWPDTFVVEKNLANLVGEIRRALDDNAASPRFIRTVPKFGYAFLNTANEARHDRGDLQTGGAVARYHVVWNGGRVALEDGDHVLGRDPSLALFLDSATVSRRHAILRIGGAGATIEDLDSKNGTFVNERRCHAPTPVADADVIRVGSIRLRLRTVRGFDSTVTG
jgi:DNA-binding winged helix-turn-helix (wHTH) protein